MKPEFCPSAPEILQHGASSRNHKVVFVFIYFGPDDLLILAKSYLMWRESKRSVEEET